MKTSGLTIELPDMKHLINLLLLLVLWGPVRAATQGCNVAQAGAPEVVFHPGLFTGGPAPARKLTDASSCPDPFEVPSGSQLPFWFGVASSAYQIEGAVNEGGRGPSIWDTFAAAPGHIAGGETAEVADDFYHRYLEDIQLMKALGIRNFRLSLAWPRLFPNGTGELNQAGVDYYNALIDALLANCIEPHVTLFHWDLPQALQDAYGGWLGAQIIPDFAAYAEAAFTLFGDRVKYWFTICEPLTICQEGFGTGVHAPGRCSDRGRCSEGNSTREPQLCAYHTLLAHAAVVPIFRQLVPQGKISMNINLAPFFVPLTSSKQDQEAAERLNSWVSGQFLDPLLLGNWTEERLAQLPEDVLPRFTPEQSQALKAAKPDLLALQYYGGAYAYWDPSSSWLQANTTTTDAEGRPLPQAESTWLHVFPASFRAMLGWVTARYGRLPIIVTENGVSVPKESSLPLEEALCDTFRVDFYRQYLGNASLAVKNDGVDLQGYFAWCATDNFEWADGYGPRFGVVYVNFATLERHYKASALFLSNLFGLPSEKGVASETPRQGFPHSEL